MRATALLVAVAASCVACAGALSSAPPQAATHVRLNGLEPGLHTQADEPLTVPHGLMTGSRGLAFTWAPQHSARGAVQSAYRVRLYKTTGASFVSNAGAAIYDSGFVASPEARAHLTGEAAAAELAGSDAAVAQPPALPPQLLQPATSYTATVEWTDGNGATAPPSEPVHFATGPSDPQWGPSEWVGTGFGMIRRNFTLADQPKPRDGLLYVATGAWFQLWVNGVRVGAAETVSGAWTVFPRRVFYWTYDLSSVLQKGENAIGIMLGAGWRNTRFNAKYPAPCASNERLVRAVLTINGTPMVATDETWHGLALADCPIQMDSVYNGETYDATLEQDGWSSPTFDETAAATAAAPWAPVTNITCFDPELTPIDIPRITTTDTHTPVSIHTVNIPSPSSGCPAGVLGGEVAENSDLTLTCAAGSGSITNITFASFGTPSGTCGSFAADSKCDSAASMATVAAACVGKTSCTISATNSEFGGDPCLNIKKRLAVEATGCKPQAGTTAQVVDFGENLSGWSRLNSIKACAKGSTITLRHAEVLMHPPYGPVNGSIYTGNLRSAKATDTYTCKGDATGESYEPSFTYHGFRYVQVEGYPGTLTSDDITQLHFRSGTTPRTQHNSSSTVLNSIQYNALTGQGSNSMSLLTDCDQRDERLGWMGDAGLSADTVSTNYDAEALEDNILRNIADSQLGSGALADITPWVIGGSDPGDGSWTAAFPQTMWVRYSVNGDITPARQHWDALGLYFANIEAQMASSGKGIAGIVNHYGDWVPAVPSTKVGNDYCAAFNYILNVQQGAELATALGDKANATALAARAEALILEFNKAYQGSNGCYDGMCFQTALSLALKIGAVPAAQVPALGKMLVDDIVSTRNNSVSVGIIGAKAMFPVLETLNESATALALAEQTSYPSWGYMSYNTLEPSVGGIWELWATPTTGPSMNSRNHHMFSSVSQWIVQHVGGVSSKAAGAACRVGTPGFASGDTTLSLIAAPLLGVSAASTTVQSPCGETHLSYRRTGGVQCAVAPEGASSSRPHASADVGDAVVDCGPAGGVVASVDFASWGAPTGGCGAFATADDHGDGACHAPASADVVSSLCLGKPSCAVPTDADFWLSHAGGWESPEHAVGACDAPWRHVYDSVEGGGIAPQALNPRRLHVQVTCSAPAAVVANVTVPVGVSAALRAPLYRAVGAAATVVVNGEAVGLGDSVADAAVDGVIRATAAAPGDLQQVAGSAAGGAVDIVLRGGSFTLRV